MLLSKDLNTLNFLSEQAFFLKDKKTEQLLYYEKKYNNNSFNIVYSTEDNEEIKQWKNATLEFIRQNGNPRIINTIIPVVYFAITNQNSDKTLEMVNLLLKYYLNSVAVITNKNLYYEKIISRFNLKGKIVLLMTDNRDDFKLDYSNLITCFSDNPERDMINYSDKVLMNINESRNPFPFLNSEKLLYV